MLPGLQVVGFKVRRTVSYETAGTTSSRTNSLRAFTAFLAAGVAARAGRALPLPLARPDRPRPVDDAAWSDALAWLRAGETATAAP